MKEQIRAFIHDLIPLDYLLFGGSFLLFMLFLFIAILLQRRVLLALFFILVGLATLFLAPIVGYIEMHHYLFKKSVTLTTQKKLHFTKAILLKGNLKNESRRYFKSCKIEASVYAVTSNKYKNYLKRLKPFQKASIVIKDIDINQTKEFKMFIDPFTYNKDYNISLGADCK